MTRKRLPFRTGLAALFAICLSATGAVAANAAPAHPSAASSTAPAPSPAPTDSFLVPPAHFAERPVGTVLRSRSVLLPNYPVPTGTRAWQLLYRTTDLHGKPMATVTTVLRLRTGAPTGLLSYQFAEDASSTRCAPSATLDSQTAVPTSTDSTAISGALNNGFAVAIPDYEGPNSDFAAPRQPGYTILDGVRAAERFQPLHLRGAASPVGLWGYSGGSLASGWAAELQPTYAPELKVRGVALGGYVNDIKATFLRINASKTIFTALLPGGLAGMFRAVPDLKREFDQYLTPAGQAMVAHGGTQCPIQNILEYRNFNADNYLTIPYATLLNSPAVSRTLAKLNLGRHTPKAPLFVYHSVSDELVPIAATDRIVKRYCAGGDSVTYLRSRTGTHAQTSAAGEPAALLWLTTRLQNQTRAGGCTTTTVASIG